MSALSINGVALPVAVDSLKMQLNHVGMQPTRNHQGYLVTDRRAVRHSISASIVTRTLEEAMLYAELVLAHGDYWSMYANAYSAKGIAVTGTGSWGTSAWNITTTTMIVPCPQQTQDAALGSFATAGLGSRLAGRDGGTLMGWRTGGGTSRAFAWSWRETDSAPTTKRERIYSGGAFGAAQAYTGSETFAWSYSAQTLTVTGGGATTYSFLCMLWIPRKFGSTQLDALLEGFVTYWLAATSGQYLPAPPRLLVGMDILPTDLVSTSGTPRHLVALGQVHGLNVTPAYIGGTFEKTALSLEISLEEV